LKKLYKNKKKTLKIFICSDPANPGFQYSDVDSTLDPSDAKFVDVIHTCSGYLGTKRKLGHAGKKLKF
jgi:hypothetical protein